MADEAADSQGENRVSLTPDELRAVPAEATTLQAAALTDIDPDDVINNLSDAAPQSALEEMVGINRQNLLAHLAVRELGSDRIFIYSVYERNTLITALVEQGIQFPPEVLSSLAPISLLPIFAFDLLDLWRAGSHWLRIAASRFTRCGRTKAQTVVPSF